MPFLPFLSHWTLLLRSIVPVPQDAEQLDQLLHGSDTGRGAVEEIGCCSRYLSFKIFEFLEARKEEPDDEVEGNSIGGDGVVNMSTGQVDGQ